MTDDENSDIDRELLDQERAQQLEQMAEAELWRLDVQRQAEMAHVEESLARQMADLERETDVRPTNDGRPDRSLSPLPAAVCRPLSVCRV